MRRCIHLMMMIMATGCCAETSVAQSASEDGDFDACGTLVRGSGCVLFEGGGGLYVLADAGSFGFGDAVRVVGTLNENCITICPEADGCIAGATVYDPAILPCGTPIGSFPEDVITGVCSTFSATLLVGLVGGLWFTRRKPLQ